VAAKLKEEMQEAIDNGSVNCFQFDEVSTQICKAQQFYLARQDDQRYFERLPGKTCNHKVWFEWPRGDTGKESGAKEEEAEEFEAEREWLADAAEREDASEAKHTPEETK